MLGNKGIPRKEVNRVVNHYEGGDCSDRSSLANLIRYRDLYNRMLIRTLRIGANKHNDQYERMHEFLRDT